MRRSTPSGHQDLQQGPRLLGLPRRQRHEIAVPEHTERAEAVDGDARLHLVRRRRPEHEPPSGPVEQPADRFEGHGHQRGGDHGEGDVGTEPAADRSADPDDDGEVDDGDEHRQPAEDDRLVDDDVDVVEAVAENGDADGQREQPAATYTKTSSPSAWSPTASSASEARPATTTTHPATAKPLQLLALDPLARRNRNTSEDNRRHRRAREHQIPDAPTTPRLDSAPAASPTGLATGGTSGSGPGANMAAANASPIASDGQPHDRPPTARQQRPSGNSEHHQDQRAKGGNVQPVHRPRSPAASGQRAPSEANSA